MRQVDGGQRDPASAPRRDHRVGGGPAQRGGRPHDEAGTSPRGAVDRRLGRVPGRDARDEPRPADRRPARRGDRAARPGRREGSAGPGRRPARAGRDATATPPRLPARAVGWTEAARDDRDGARVQPEPGDRRRAHHRARRDGAGAGPEPAEQAAARARPRDALHHARPVGPRRDLRPARDHVRGQDRRGGTLDARVRDACPPVHRGALGGVPRDRRPTVPPGSVWSGRATRRSPSPCRRGVRSTHGAPSPSTNARRSVPELYEAGEHRRAACLLVPKRAQVAP